MKAIPVILLAVTVITVGFAAYGNQARAADRTPAAIMPVMDTATATIQPTATPNYSPTPDFLYLAKSTQAALDIELAQARNTAEVAAITATAIVADARATEQRLVDQRMTSQAFAQATGTQAANATQRTVMFAMATLDMDRTATAQAPINRRNEIIADWEPIIRLTYTLSIVLLSLFIGYMALLVANAKYQQIREEREITRSAAEPDHFVEVNNMVEPVVIQETKHNGGYHQVMQTELPLCVTREQIEQIADAVLNRGETFSRSSMVDKRILTDGEWDAFRWWMSRRGYASPVKPDQQNSPWYVSALGQDFLRAFKPPTAG